MVFSDSLTSRMHDGNAKWFTLIAACFGFFMAILDNLVVNIAACRRSHATRRHDDTATMGGFRLSDHLASLQITAGGLGDRFGSKRWFLIGLASLYRDVLSGGFLEQHGDVDRHALPAGPGCGVDHAAVAGR